MGWIYVDDIEITDAVNSIHVDTRDFHCNLLEEKIDLRDRRHPEITRCKHNNAYMIKADKIKEWLKGLETLTGGKGTWRLMSFRHTPDRGWFSMMRITLLLSQHGTKMSKEKSNNRTLPYSTRTE